MIALSPGVPLVAVERSGVIESIHAGHLIVLDPDGSVRHSAGEPSQPMFGRSSLKPLQAVGLLREALIIEPDELALAAASHSGSPLHISLIEAELAAAGLSESDLECPPDLPLGVDERRAYLVAGQTERRLAMNCSGKHAGMLRAALLHPEWPLSGYVAVEHPLQRALAATVSELTGDPIAAVGVDGCGAAQFAVSLTGIARAFARIARAADGPEKQVADAMRQHPELVGGVGRPVTNLMQGVAGLIAKDGAEGVFVAALPDGGAVAVKIDDGALRASVPALIDGLRLLGVSGAVLDDLASEPVLGGGIPVGSVHVITEAR